MNALRALSLALIPLALVQPAFGQALGFLPQGDQPIEVEAEDGVEWHRDTQKYVAKGKARATQGGMSVLADVLTAYYRAAEAGTEIFRIDAEGNVTIATERETATGDRAVFDVKSGVLVMTGERIELKTPQETVTARDSLEYNVDKRVAIARGAAHAGRGEQHLYADRLDAHFRTADAPGGRTSDLERVEALGNVVVVTPQDVVQAARGDYDPISGIVRMNGQVRLTRDRSQINGEQAEVNLNTGISRIIGAGRVAIGREGPPAAAPAERARALIVPKPKPLATER